MRIGQRVFIEELRQYGNIVELQPLQGKLTVSKVKIITPTGPEIINVLKYTVRIVSLISTLLPWIKRIVNGIKRLFKGDGKKKPEIEKEPPEEQLGVMHQSTTDKNIRHLPKGAGIQLTEHFNSDEFDCKCDRKDCKVTLINMYHVNKLDRMRKRLGVPLIINSGYRCKKHNAEVGGVVGSQHTLGNATDVDCVYPPDYVAALAEEMEYDGIGRYDTFTHLDSRGRTARWDYRTTVV